jgi:hypothetical protein
VEIAHLAALLGELTGRRLPQRTAPDWVLQPRRPPGRPRAAREPVRLPVSAEQVDLPFSTRPASSWMTPRHAASWPSGGANFARRWLTPRLAGRTGLVTARQVGSLAS